MEDVRVVSKALTLIMKSDDFVCIIIIYIVMVSVERAMHTKLYILKMSFVSLQIIISFLVSTFGIFRHLSSNYFEKLPPGLFLNTRNLKELYVLHFVA